MRKHLTRPENCTKVTILIMKSFSFLNAFNKARNEYEYYNLNTEIILFYKFF